MLLLFPCHAQQGASRLRRSSAIAACESSRLLVLLRGMWQQRGPGLPFPADPGVSVRNRRARGWTAGRQQSRSRRRTWKSDCGTKRLMWPRSDSVQVGNTLDIWIAICYRFVWSVSVESLPTRHLQWCGLRSGGEPPPPQWWFSASWDTLYLRLWPKPCRRNRLLKVKVPFLLW